MGRGRRSRAPDRPILPHQDGGPKLNDPGSTLPETADPRDRDFRYNLTWGLSCEALWGFAMPLVTVGTIVAVFLKRLGAGEFVIALLPTVTMVCTGLTQLPVTAMTRRLRRKVGASAVLFGFAGIGWLGAGVLAVHIADTRPDLMIVGVLVLFSVASLFMGAANPLWSDVIARLYPERKRGLAQGLLWTFVGGFGILGAWWARHTLATVPFPWSFARLLIVAGTIVALGTQLLWLCREYVPPAQNGGETGSYLSLVRSHWRADRRLRRMVLSRWLFDLGGPVAVFFAVHGIDKYGLDDTAAGTYTLIACGAGMVAGLALGPLGDRRGYRRVMGWAMALMACATVWALVAGSVNSYMLVFLLQGMAQTGIYMGTLNFLIECSPDQSDCATPMALFSTFMLPVWLLGPMAMGAIAERMSIPTAFYTGLCLQLLGLIALICLVDDPRRPGRRILVWPGPGRRGLPRFRA